MGEFLVFDRGEASEAPFPAAGVDRLGACRTAGPSPTGRRRRSTSRQVSVGGAVDGKTLRGARDERGKQTSLVAVVDHAEHLALSRVQVVGAEELAVFGP